MPPKPPSKSTESAGITLQSYCEAIKGVVVMNEATGKRVDKGDAALHCWSHALGGDSAREDIFKTQCTPNLLMLVDRGDVEEKFAAMGVLSVLAQSEKHLSEVVNSKVILVAAQMLTGDHLRSKLPAAQLLSLLAERAEYSSKVADVALGPLSQALMDNGPGWAQTQQLQNHAASAIKALIENVKGESNDIKLSRRLALLQAGVVPHLVHLVSSAPRMPKPALYPAPPPAVGKGGVIKSVKGKGKKGDDDCPQGRKDAIATAAAACLRFLASCPGFVEQLTAAGSLQQFVDALLSSNDAQSAYISGILWEICADEDVARKVQGCGAVSALLHVCSRFLSAAGSKKPSKKKEAVPDKKEKLAPPPPPNFADMAVCNAAGALHHLTFLDEAKLEVGKVGGMPILVACIRVNNIQTYENATGALWNVGLDINNTAALKDVGAPEFLSQPVPSTWQLDHNSKEGMQGNEEGNDFEEGTFITKV